jgi:hypothetical protein
MPHAWVACFLDLPPSPPFYLLLAMLLHCCACTTALLSTSYCVLKELLGQQRVYGRTRPERFGEVHVENNLHQKNANKTNKTKAGRWLPSAASAGRVLLPFFAWLLTAVYGRTPGLFKSLDVQTEDPPVLSERLPRSVFAARRAGRGGRVSGRGQLVPLLLSIKAHA